MLNVIDPSVVDEHDPTVHRSGMGHVQPGERLPPVPGAQHLRPNMARRVSRETARAYPPPRRNRARMRSPTIATRATACELPTSRRYRRTSAHAVTRRGWLGRYMIIYRTLANPAYLDPSIDPSNRPLGSIFSPGDPIIGNYGPGGLARVMTPRAWLSTWSGLSSQADLPDTIGHVTIPTLIVYADGDCDIFPAEQRELFEKSGAADKTLHGAPVGRPLPPPRRRAGRTARRPARAPHRHDRPVDPAAHRRAVEAALAPRAPDRLSSRAKLRT